MPDEILLVDDQPEVLEHLAKILRPKGFVVVTARQGEEGLKLLVERASSLSLVILDLDLGGGRDDGLEVLGKMKEAAPDVPVIILTGKGTARAAVQAMKLGAADFLEKDLYLAEHLEARVARVREFLKLIEENRRLKNEGTRLRRTASYYNERLRERYELVGNSQVMVELRNKIESLASVPRPVLIRGERGTGKELVAAQIHYCGKRASQPFVVVNCAAVEPRLLASELFGHEKGAFTGAEGRRIGRFESADGGTLFLDEIGTMSLDFQEKILRVIEYHSFERVRGTHTLHIDVRVVTATNADLEELQEAGRFREDLYDRLSFQTIHTPALREHAEDIPALAHSFLAGFRAQVPSVVAESFSEPAMEKLMSCRWPGNVRELKNVVERAATIADGPVVGPEHLELRSSHPRPLDGTFGEKVQALERSLITEALERADFSQRKAAKILGLTYDQFRHYYRKYKDSAGGKT